MHIRGLTVQQPWFSLVSNLIPFRSQAKSAKFYAGLRSSGCASKIGEFINNLKFLSIHSDSWFAVRLSRG